MSGQTSRPPQGRPEASDRLRRLRQRLGALFEFDFGDEEHRRLLRSWVIVIASLVGVIGALRIVVIALFTGEAVPVTTWLALAYMVLNTIWAWWRGARIGDFAFGGVLAVGIVVTAIAVSGYAGGPDLPRTAAALVMVAVIAALFLESAVSVVLLTLVAVATLGVLAAVVPVDPVVTGNDLFLAVTSLLVVTLCLRVARDRAVAALLEARRAASTDLLTGLANRRGLEELVVERWALGVQAGLPVVVLVVDVDHFKRVNDTLGHAAGDDLLRRFGALLTSLVRQEDLAVRLGGEEFLVLCPASPQQGVRVAERIRVETARELAPITVSVGMHVARPAAGDSLPDAVWAAVRIADRALYEAKRSGRNRVVTSVAAGLARPTVGE